MQQQENLLVSAEWHLKFEHTLGPAATTFLTNLRDNQALLATRCDSCERTLVPPRDFCERCFVDVPAPDVVLSTEGVIKGYTIVYAELPGYRKPPYALAYVQPDGADTAIGNYLEGVDLEDMDRANEMITIGTRVQAKFADDRQGRITDFHWELAPSETSGSTS